MERLSSADFADIIREAMAEQTFGPSGELSVAKIVTTFSGHDYHMTDGTVFTVAVGDRKMDTPNLDCMSDDDLMPFWQKHQNGRAYRALFPNGGKSTKRATADLANYASNLRTARQCRARGDIATAQMYEGICERIYKGLPDFARW